MRFHRPLTLTVALTTLAGCETTPKERLQGRWIGDTVESFHPSHVARAQGWVQGMAFEFKGRRVTVSIPAESPRQGTYEITEAGERQLLVKFVRLQGVEDQAALVFEGEDQLRWMLGDGRSILLRKEASDS